MSETYESIGNQVLRNFRHNIDAHHHFWLESDHRFLPPADLVPSALQSQPPQGEGSGVIKEGSKFSKGIGCQETEDLQVKGASNTPK